MKYLLAHDLGTSGNKATLFTTKGEMVKSEVYAYSTKWYNDVWAEQDPDIWYEAVKVTTQRILSNVDNKDVIGLSFSGQMMGCLCVNELGQPLYPSIIWADMRAIEEENFVRANIPEDEFYKITGHRPSASYGLAKLLWLKNHQPKVYEQCYKVLNAKDYIIYKLTGNFVTDYSDASGTNLLDINTLSWSERIAESVQVDLTKMPKLCKSTDIVGIVNEKAALETGLSQGTSVICGGGDGSMSAVGARCITPGDAFCTLGTSAWNATTSKTPVYDPEMRIFNWVHVIPGMYIPCGTMQAAGASLSWLRDQMAQLEIEQCKKEETNVYERINEIVAKTNPGANGVYYLPYLMGERSPRWNPEARGSFIGMKMETTKADLFRSVYEGVAYNLEIILKLVLKDMNLKSLIMTGGGAKSEIWCQIIADIYNVTIKVPNHIEEATSIGAAVTAGVGLGIYESFDVIDDFIQIDNEFETITDNADYYNKMKPIFEQMYQVLKPVYHEMSKL